MRFYGEPYDEIAYRIHEMASSIELERQVDGIPVDPEGRETIQMVSFVQEVDLWRVVVAFDDQGLERIEWTRAGADGCRTMSADPEGGPSACGP